MPRLDGSTHVNLTVTDLERSTDWYQRVFGLVLVNDVTPPGSGFRFRTLLHPQSFASVVLGVPQADGGPAGDAGSQDGGGPAGDGGPQAGGGPDRFDEGRVGLHHLGYHVPERADLEEWVAHLDAQQVEHSGITVSKHEAGVQVWFRDPDNIWLEVYWVNKAFFADRLRQRWRAARREGRAASWVTPPPPAD